jgi:hypothetical protein
MYWIYSLIIMALNKYMSYFLVKYTIFNILIWFSGIRCTWNELDYKCLENPLITLNESLLSSALIFSVVGKDSIVGNIYKKKKQNFTTWGYCTTYLICRVSYVICFIYDLKALLHKNLRWEVIGFLISHLFNYSTDTQQTQQAH